MPVELQRISLPLLFLTAMGWSAATLAAGAAATPPARPPVVKVCPEKLVLGGAEVLLEGEASDPDGDAKRHPLRCMWTQVAGPGPAEIVKAGDLRTPVRRLVQGCYTFRLTATDPAEMNAFAETTVEVRPAPPPGIQITADDPHLQFTGRTWRPAAGMVELGWPGVTMKARFSGTSLRIRMNQGWGPPPKALAILDGKADTAALIYVDNRTDYLIADKLAPGEHALELVRLGGGWQGAIEFRGLVLDAGGALLPPPPRPARRIEFYGDSITEGSYMEDQEVCNAYRAYAMTTARLLEAEAHLLAKGGLGMVRGYALPQTLPGIYDRAVPMRGDAKWDFQSWTPQVVVLNIFQNDKWTQGQVPAEEFIAAYSKFLGTLRGHYPRATLVAALGSMDAVAPGSAWPDYVRQAVERHRIATGDKRVGTFFFPFLGRRAHPNTREAAAMAEALAAHLRAQGEALWQDTP